jgi:hypothetical protein
MPQIRRRTATMRSHLRRAAIAIMLVGSSGLATAQTSGMSPSSGGLELTSQQRAEIFRIVIRDKDKVKLPPATNPPAIVGAEMPPSMELYMLPDNIGTEVPEAKLYKYTIVQNQVIIVDPTTMKIIDVIRQ